MGNQVQFLGLNSERLPSPGIWGNIQHEAIKEGIVDGIHLFNDLIDMPVMASATAQGPWYSYQDTSCTIFNDTTKTKGVAKILLNAAGNTEAHLEYGAGKGGLFRIKATEGKFAFEAAVMVSAITDTALLVGLASPGASANSLLADTTGAVSTTPSFVGFRVLLADPDGLDAVYQTASGSETVAAEVAHNFTVNTWVKVGLYFNGVDTFYWYINGAQVGSVAITASGFPDNVDLVPIFGHKTITGAANIMYVDWFKFCLESKTTTLN